MAEFTVVMDDSSLNVMELAECVEREARLLQLLHAFHYSLPEGFVTTATSSAKLRAKNPSSVKWGTHSNTRPDKRAARPTAWTDLRLLFQQLVECWSYQDLVDTVF